MPEITNFPGATAYDARGVPTVPSSAPPLLAAMYMQTWKQISKLGNRVVGTTTERSAAAAWAWEGLEFYDTTEKRSYIRVGSAWLGGDYPDGAITITPSSGTTIPSYSITSNNKTVEIIARFERSASIASGTVLGQLSGSFPSVVWALGGSVATATASSATLRIGIDGQLSYIGTTSSPTFWVSSKYVKG